MVNRTGWGSADLRQQHLFVLEAGDPRDVSCKSEKHSSRSICICLYVLNLFEYLITSTHANSHELLLSFPCVPEILRTHTYTVFPAFWLKLQTAGFSFQPWQKEQSLWSSLLLAVPRQQRGNVVQCSQPAVCRGRAKERAAKP